MLDRKRWQMPLGVLFSTTGPYSIIGTAMYQGTMLAIEEIGADPSFDFGFEPVVMNPDGRLDAYRELCEAMIREHEVVHVVGCYTSSSRKELIPLLEKRDALLWYPSHYEGFECSPNVIYTGASPNQHVVPLAQYLVEAFGPRIYCVGSNYIWPWECNRVFREIVQKNDGEIVHERYAPMGDTDFGKIIQEIVAARPNVVFSTLIGESCYAFCRAYGALREAEPSLGLAQVPVASCTLSEPELVAIGGDAALGHLTSSVYLQTVDTPENQRFVASFRHKFGPQAVTSADAEASYLAVHLLARALRDAGETSVEAVRSAVGAVGFAAPQGPVRVDPTNNHCYLTPRIGRSVEGAMFDVVRTAGEPIRPDPYLVWFDPSQPVLARGAALPQARQGGQT